MKRLTAILGAAFMELIFSASPAHALKVVVATIFAGNVEVIGIQAKKSAGITWEGDAVTQSNRGGAFHFSTTHLPQDCVGELSDGVTTIQVVVFGCTTQQVVGGGVLKTGQTTSFQTGDDGDLELGTARSYKDNVDGTITDNATGLIWEKLGNLDGSLNLSDPHDADNTHTWLDAFQKVADLNTANFAGHNDWRLPNVNELQTLVDHGTFSPAVSAAFNSADSFTQSPFYWSSTTLAPDPDFAWGVFFFTGGVGNDFKEMPNFVRAVRGGS